jgi:amidase
MTSISSRATMAFFIFTIYFVAWYWRLMAQMTPNTILVGTRPWQEIAAEKRQRDMDKMPKEWILPFSVLNEGKKRRSIAGHFIKGLLDEETLLITKVDVPEIAERTSNSSLTAVQVVMAFSKRAAYAHQLVSLHKFFPPQSDENLLEIAFDIALEEPENLTNISKGAKILLVLYMVSLSLSKTNFTPEVLKPPWLT